MEYIEVVDKVRSVFEHVDARNVFEHVAFQIDIIGEASGSFYFEIAGRSAVVEPYDYHDNDGVFEASAKILCECADRERTMHEAMADGLIKFTGDEKKLNMCFEKVKLPPKKKKSKKISEDAE